MTPPWEKHSIPQVPYALPDLWATRTHIVSSPRPSVSTAGSGATPQRSSSPGSVESQKHMWKRSTDARLPPSAIQFCAPAPYGTQLYATTASKSTTSAARAVTSSAGTTPTPPDSSKGSSESSVGGSPRSRQTVTALPGTMSSRSRGPSRSRAKGQMRPHNAAKKDRAPMGFGKRCKSTFKGMFKRDAIDESQYEHLSDRHWTEEY
ncbi:hypothetical protein LTR53_002149 [Teratosphaeriaceae sp. CCFEE 6253]|nr:hypothetical protein LTR53_002149 [Teratosphaeriaceae sp. CCFEE 6253]